MCADRYCQLVEVVLVLAAAPMRCRHRDMAHRDGGLGRCVEAMGVFEVEEHPVEVEQVAASGP